MRDFRTVDTTYGQKQEIVSPVYVYPPDTINHGQATVNGSATLRAANGKRQRIIIFNLGGDILYVGSTGLTPATAFPIPGGEKQEFKTTSAILVTSVASLDVRFIEELLGPDA